MKAINKDTVAIASSIVVAAVIIAVVILVATARIHSTGTIQSLGMGVYTDPQCTITASVINWGNLAAGDSSSIDLYVKLTGNSPANLTISIENWNPAIASQYIIISWDYGNQTLMPTQAYKLTLTCTVLAQVSGITDFSNDIVITATYHK